MEPTCANTIIHTTAEAHTIMYAVLCQLRPLITRRPCNEEERSTIRSGAVFVFEEGTGIERWTDKRDWGDSRSREDFLFYTEGNKTATRPPTFGAFTTTPHWPPSSSPGQTSGPDPLIKQTYTARVDRRDGTQKRWHLIAYFTEGTKGHLQRVHADPVLAQLIVPAGTFVQSRKPKSRRARPATAMAGPPAASMSGVGVGLRASRPGGGAAGFRDERAHSWYGGPLTPGVGGAGSGAGRRRASYTDADMDVDMDVDVHMGMGMDMRGGGEPGAVHLHAAPALSSGRALPHSAPATGGAGRLARRSPPGAGAWPFDAGRARASSSSGGSDSCPSGGSSDAERDAPSRAVRPLPRRSTAPGGGEDAVPRTRQALPFPAPPAARPATPAASAPRTPLLKMTTLPPLSFGGTESPPQRDPFDHALVSKLAVAV